MKKIVSVLLAAAMLTGLSTNAFALRRIDTINPNFRASTAYTVDVRTQGRVRTNYGVNNLVNFSAEPEDYVRIYIRPEAFVDSNGTMVRESDSDVVTTAALRNGKITVKSSLGSGRNLVESLKVKNDSSRGAYIELKFVKYFVSVEEKDFDMKLYLAVNGRRRTETMVNIAGSIANHEFEVDAGDSYVDLSDGEVAEATEFIRRIEVDLGNGVTITTSMTNGRRYYGIVDTTPTSADEIVLNNNPAVDVVYYMKTVNLSRSGNVVDFDLGYTAYIYDADGSYLGTSSETLPFSTKYYICSTRVDSVNI